MTSATAPEKTRLGNRAKLLRAAIVCLRDRGYAHTTARDLVAESGANLASIGYHFGSKEALLNEAIAETMNAWVESTRAHAFADEGAPPSERVERVLAATIDRFEELQPFLVSFVEAFPPAARSPQLRERLARAYEDVRLAGADLVARALESSGVDLAPGQARDLASLTLAMCDGLILQWLLDPGAVPDSRRALEALRAAAAAVAR